MSLSPILLFTYNRPEHTRLTLEALRKNHLSDRSRLYIFSDGYRNETDREEVMKVRELIRSVEGFASIHIEERTENVGLARNIIEGVTGVVNEHGKVIVLEDDLITSPYFLTFMNDVLERYEQEEKIAHVQGFCFPLLDLPDAFLIKWTGSWGWATWKRAWDIFNPDGEALLSEIMKKKLNREFDFNDNYPFTRMLRRQVNGENDSWAIRWNASLFLKNKLSVNAGKSLVQNIGFDGSGRHSGRDVIYTTPLHMSALSSEIPRIEENKAVRKSFEKYYMRTNSLLAKGVRRIKRILRV
ncbi:glycosyltransferase [Dysgonomonadaceae bacterium zrk40]|nr:glycosyltransferase [Dysgonomonadaceae bacterium zrk40]